MPGSTAGLAMPYPLATEPVSQGDDAIKALAERIELVMGSAWTAFTPTWVNLTVGNAGNNIGRYKQIGKTVHVRYELAFGSTTTVQGTFYPNLPVTSQGGPVYSGSVWMFDASPATWAQGAFVPGAYNVVTVGTGTTGLAAATFPWTWAVNDAVRISLTYEAA